MKKICFVTTKPLIVNSFLVPCLATLTRVYRVRLALNPDEDTGHWRKCIAPK